MKKLLLLVFLACSIALRAQQTTLSGSIKDYESSEPVIGANISVKGKMVGTITDGKGNFSFTSSVPVPFTLVVSVIGYQRQEIEVTDASQQLAISLAPKTEVMDEVVISASRVEESILRSPVSIEKMDGKDIRETPSINFYEGLQNIKGVEMVTSGLTYKQINTRGFNDTGNSRFLQLVDGVDNQTPGLSFAVGNLFGSSDLDMESAELVPGSASALYGPVAFNGVLMMRTKNPFQYQGLSAQVRVGVNHMSEKYADPHGLYDYSIRYAKAFNNRFAFKLNASYFKGLDWFATNYTDVSKAPGEKGDNNPARDALNIYGDDSFRDLPGIGAVSRTGYEERDLLNYNVYSVKLNGALHYRIADNIEVIYQYNYNQGRAAYTGSNRFQLNDFNFQQHRVEVRGGNYFVRAYANLEDSKNSYNGKGLGQLINKTWVQNLDGSLVTDPNQADNVWYTRYSEAFNGNINGVTAASSSEARAFADQGRYLPGSAEYNAEKERLIGLQGLQSGGAGILSQSKFYHVEGQYDLSNKVKVVDVLVGGNFRMYDMFTNGTLFDDKDNPIKIKEGGAFVQLSKKLLQENLKLTASLRYDKNQNFDGHVTPRASAVYTVAKNHNFRTSFQTGFRNPTPGDQYIKLNAGPITILGGVPDNSKGMNVYENSFTASSLGPFYGAYYGALQGGATPDQALEGAKDQLVKSNVPYIKPEQVKTFEIGYKGLVAEKLLIDANYYFSSYTDFLLNQVVIQPESPVLTNDGTVNIDAAADIANGDSHLFQLYTNASDRVTTQGATFGLTYLLPKGYTLGANGTWAAFNIQNANPNEIPRFNTPKYRTTVTFGNSSVTKNIGFNLAWRWQDTFEWYGTFNQMRPGTINAYSIVDAQVSYKVHPIKSIIKIGGNNILNQQVYQAYGSPSIGAVYYVSIVFDQFLNR